MNVGWIPLDTASADRLFPIVKKLSSPLLHITRLDA